MRFAALLFIAGLAAADQAIDKRNQAYGNEIEQYFRQWLVEDYPARAAKAWSRSYASVPAFLKSVEGNRARYRRIFSPPDLKPSGPLRREPVTVEGIRAEWLTLPLGGLKANAPSFSQSRTHGLVGRTPSSAAGPLAGPFVTAKSEADQGVGLRARGPAPQKAWGIRLKAEALLAIPENAAGPVPLVIAQHGIDSFPERVFGADDPRNLYKAYGRALAAEGFAVLAPMNLFTVEKRNRMERLARLADTTLPGLELVRVQRLLDEVLKDKRIDRERIGMWGISLGGMATMFWTPLEPRIRCGIVTAWFNHRRNKMVLPDPRYSCFLETKEEHAFFRGWLTEFTDSDVASLICPRPLMVQTGKKDGIAWWPQVVEEFEAAKEHYRKLKLEDRIEMVLHEGGHEIHLESGLAFMKKWLK